MKIVSRPTVNTHTRKFRLAYQVVIDDGPRTKQVGWKGRLFGKRRAAKVCKFLVKRGHEARIRCFGKIVLPDHPRLFD